MRTVARAEIAPDPVLAQVRGRHFRAEGGRATQVGADTDQQQNFRLDRANFLIDVSGLVGILRVGVGQLALDLLQISQDFLGTTNDEHWLTAPFSNHLLAWIDLADIHLHRCTCGFRLGTGKP